jgi:hypothetical protein
MGNNLHTLIKTILNEKMSWDYESVKKEAEKYPNRNQFKINLPGAYEFAVKNGILDKILPISKNKWDYESVKKEAEKYPSYVEFQKNSPGAYNFAIKNKIINDFFPARKIWDVKSIEDESKKYKSRQEFKYGSPTSYVSAWRKGMLDTLFPQRLTTSVGERIVDEFLTKNGINFKREKTFEGCFVEKNNKCFKLKYDFYLPEKNTLIEYDGIGHYKPVDRFGGEEGFSTRRMYDFIKDKFAESQNMKLIRIPYTVRTIDEVGKYLNTITESDITRIVKRVLKEQQSDLSKCANQYVDFLFEPSIMDENNEVLDGGDLFYWNNNEIPQLNDTEAFIRFVKHLKYVIEDVKIFSDEECGDVTFEKIIPIIQNLYREKITKTTNSEKNPDDNFYKLIIGLYSENGQTVPINIRRRMSNFSVIESINQTMIDNPPNEFDDEFEYADNILNWTAEIYYPYLDEIDSMDEIIDFMKEEYSDIIFDNFYSQE